MTIDKARVELGMIYVCERLDRAVTKVCQNCDCGMVIADQQAAPPAEATEIETRLRERAPPKHLSESPLEVRAADTIAALREENDRLKTQLIAMGSLFDCQEDVGDLTTERGDAQAKRIEALEAGLKSAIKIADEAREEWDKAPEGMRAGKILIALSGGLPGYRKDIDDVRSVLASKEG